MDSVQQLEQQLRLAEEGQNRLRKEAQVLKQRLSRARCSPNANGASPPGPAPLTASKSEYRPASSGLRKDGGPVVRRATSGMAQRSQSNMGFSGSSANNGGLMIQSFSQHGVPSQTMQRSLSRQSNQAEPTAHRSRPVASDRPMPFSGNGRVAPFPGANTGMLQHYCESQEAPVSAQMLASQPQHGSPPSRHGGQRDDPLAGVGHDPADFFSIADPSMYSSFAQQPQEPFFVNPNDQYGFPTSDGPPSLVSGPSAEDSPMSRQNSNDHGNGRNESVIGALEMARLESGYSHAAPSLLDQDSYNTQFYGSHISPSTKSAETLLGIGSNLGFESVDMARTLSSVSMKSNSSNGARFGMGSLEMSRSISDTSVRSTSSTLERRGHIEIDPMPLMARSMSTTSAKSTASNLENYSHFETESAEMIRSASNTSNTSTKSTASNLERRAKEARERQIANGRNQNIKAKPEIEMEVKTAARPHASSKKPSKVALPKNHYQRPKRAKVFCTRCTDYPEGFRGDHELRRHVAAKHQDTVKKWICRDPGTLSTMKAVNPLIRCKSCTGKKQYGAYYNAAAHLRRTHFKPKASRNKSRRAGDDADRRAGKGGGDWPEMTELKLWMEQVEVTPTDEDSMEMDEEEPLETNVIDQETYGIRANVESYPMSLSSDPYTAEPSFDLNSPSDLGYACYSPSTTSQMQSELGFPDYNAPSFASPMSSNTVTPSQYNDFSQHIFDDMVSA